MAARTVTKVTYVDNETVIGASNLNALQDAVNDHASLIDGLDTNKVSKVAGKGLSTNDFTNDAQNKLSGLPTVTDLDTTLETKVDKRTSGTEVYMHNATTQGGATLTETPTAGAVPLYGTNGVLKVGPPTANNDAVRKAELDEIDDRVTSLNQAINVFDDNLPGTVQTVNFGSDGKPASVVHTKNGTTVRTDTYTWGTGTVTETRTLASGAYVTMVTDLTTLVTTISEIQEAS